MIVKLYMFRNKYWFEGFVYKIVIILSNLCYGFILIVFKLMLIVYCNDIMFKV